MSINEFISQNQESLDIMLFTLTLSYFCFSMDKIVNWYHQYHTNLHRCRLAQSELHFFILEMIHVSINRNRDIQEYLGRNVQPPDILVKRTMRWLQYSTECDIKNAMK